MPEWRWRLRTGHFRQQKAGYAPDTATGSRMAASHCRSRRLTAARYTTNANSMTGHIGERLDDNPADPFSLGAGRRNEGDGTPIASQVTDNTMLRRLPECRQMIRRTSLNARLVRLHAVALMLVLAPLAAQATAPELADHEQLRGLAERHALQLVAGLAPEPARIRAEAARLDPRLRLPACERSAETFDPPGQRPGANMSIGIRCPSMAGWTLYIPVRVEMVADVVVLATPVGRGATLTAAHVRLESHDLAQLNGSWLTDPDEAVGMVLRRPVRPGTVLTSNVLERPKLVRRGERVRVVATGGGFAVASEGEALNDAAEGERVRVRNLHSRSVIEGRVGADGQVMTAR